MINASDLYFLEKVVMKKTNHINIIKTNNEIITPEDIFNTECAEQEFQHLAPPHREMPHYQTPAPPHYDVPYRAKSS